MQGFVANHGCPTLSMVPHAHLQSGRKQPSDVRFRCCLASCPPLCAWSVVGDTLTSRVLRDVADGPCRGLLHRRVELLQAGETNPPVFKEYCQTGRSEGWARAVSLNTFGCQMMRASAARVPKTVTAFANTKQQLNHHSVCIVQGEELKARSIYTLRGIHKNGTLLKVAQDNPSNECPALSHIVPLSRVPAHPRPPNPPLPAPGQASVSPPRGARTRPPFCRTCSRPHEAGRTTITLWAWSMLGPLFPACGNEM